MAEIPSNKDNQQTLLWKLGIALTAADSPLIQLLQKIDDNTDEIEIKADQIILNTDAINVNTDDIEARLGDETSAKETDPDAASANLNALSRGILEASNSIASALTPTTPAVGTWTSTADDTPSVAFPSNACKSFRFKNRTGLRVAVRPAGGGTEEIIDANDSAVFPCVANMDEWEWSNDEDATSITLTGVFDNT